MNALLQEYLPLVIFIGISSVIGLALLVAPFIVAYRQPDPEKLSAYECGFNAFDDARMKFDVRFYLIAILFIIFDLEVAFLFPWAIAFGQLGAFGFWSMMLFLAILTIGLTPAPAGRWGLTTCSTSASITSWPTRGSLPRRLTTSLCGRVPARSCG
jgi:NADH-quinone oxidoreductase subunit A